MRSRTRQTWAARRRFSHSTFFSLSFFARPECEILGAAHVRFVQERLLSPLANFLMGLVEKNGGSTAKYRLLANPAIYTLRCVSSQGILKELPHLKIETDKKIMSMPPTCILYYKHTPYSIMMKISTRLTVI